MSVKDVRNLQQNSESRSKSEQNDGSGQRYEKPGHAHSDLSKKNCEAVDWSTTAQVQNPRDLKNFDISRSVVIMTGELCHQSTRLEFPWKIPFLSLALSENKVKMA